MTANVIARMLEKRGFNAYFVGGAVRDRLLYLNPNDVDVATNARPEQVEAVFSHNHKVKTVGKAFGVVLVDGVEVATFRTDSYGGRDHKDCVVTYANTIEEDLSRRDFTVNAMAMDLHSNLIDPHDGCRDLRHRLVRFVGDGHARIEEDPNRMLRACRFVAHLDGVMVRDTVDAIRQNCDLMEYVAPERVRLEVLKAMKSRKASKFFDALRECGLMFSVFPSLVATFNHTGGNYHPEDVYIHSMMTGDRISTRCPLTKLAGYLHDVGKPITFDLDGRFLEHEKVGANLVVKELAALKFSNEENRAVTGLVRMHMRTATVLTTDKGVRRLLRKLTDQGIHYRDYLRLFLADRNSNTGLDPMSTEKVRHMVNTVEDQMSVASGVTKVTDLAVNGNDVMRIKSFKPGKHIGQILNHLLDVVLDDPSLNTKENLELILQTS